MENEARDGDAQHRRRRKCHLEYLQLIYTSEDPALNTSAALRSVLRLKSGSRHETLAYPGAPLLGLGQLKRGFRRGVGGQRAGKVPMPLKCQSGEYWAWWAAPHPINSQHRGPPISHASCLAPGVNHASKVLWKGRSTAGTVCGSTRDPEYHSSKPQQALQLCQVLL